MPDGDDQGSLLAFDQASDRRARTRERKRAERDRKAVLASPLRYTTEEWRDYLSPTTLARKAGADIDDLPAMVLKELCDNAADAGAEPTLERSEDGGWIVGDDGPGIDPADVQKLFSISRPLWSQKNKRLPSRGSLGNGLRVCMGWARRLTVTTRGVLMRLEVDELTGGTVVLERESVPLTPGVTVELPGDLPWDRGYQGQDTRLARLVIDAACVGVDYYGPSSPWWYGAVDFARLLLTAPPDATAADVVRDLGQVPPQHLGGRLANDFSKEDAADLLEELRDRNPPVKPEKIGRLGRDYANNWPGYAIRTGLVHERDGGRVPYVVEAFATCERSGERGRGEVRYGLLINKSGSPGELRGVSSPEGIVIHGCGLIQATVDAPTGLYDIDISIITPYVQLISDGKAPVLSSYRTAIVEAVERAGRQAHRASDPAEPKLKTEPKLKREKPSPFEPTGKLGRLIKAESEAASLSVPALTVLSASNDPYRLDTAEGHALGRWCAGQIDLLLPDRHRVIHLRGLHYMLVAHGKIQKPDGTTYENNLEDWIWLQSVVSKAARWLGYVPFERIKDNRADPPRLFRHEDDGGYGGEAGAREIVSGELVEVPGQKLLLPRVRWGRGDRPRQHYRIVMAGEKSSLEDVLLPIAANAADELFLGTGEASDTHTAEIAARAAADGRPLVILYFTDFDPSGNQMPVSVARKIQAHVDLRFPELRAELHHVALTLDQVLELGLPSTPLKGTEKRATKWRDATGREQTEIDALAALRPDVLRQIAEDALLPFYDPTLDGRFEAASDEFEAAAEAWFERLPEYAKVAREIAEARAVAVTAVAALADAQRRALDVMSVAADDADDPPEPPDTMAIEPELAEDAPEPLFTTENDWLTATQKLIDRKRLADLGGDDGESDDDG
jgi:Histidine kinase-, DNA gyrase B-, and HSP90-like ATPase